MVLLRFYLFGQAEQARPDPWLWLLAHLCHHALLLFFCSCKSLHEVLSSQLSLPYGLDSSLLVRSYAAVFALWEKVVDSTDALPIGPCGQVPGLPQPHPHPNCSRASPVRHMTDYIISPLSPLCPRSVDHPLPGSPLSTDFGSWQMVTGCGSIQERAVLHTDSSLPFSFPDELPNNCL